MPRTSTTPTAHAAALPNVDPLICVITKDGAEVRAHILETNSDKDECLVHYLDTDKAMDEWVSSNRCQLVETPLPSAERPEVAAAAGKKRKRGPGRPPSFSPRHTQGLNGTSTPDSEVSSTSGSSSLRRRRNSDATANANGRDVLMADLPEPPASGATAATAQEDVQMPDEDSFEQRRKKTSKLERNFDYVYSGNHKIKTWYFSPYPLDDLEEINPTNGSSSRTDKPPGITRAPGRQHNKTSDLFSGLHRHQGPGNELPSLFVCAFCFKYFSEAHSWEIHQKGCTVAEPPGKVVYARGAHIIREIDGAVAKLYCQNLSLFGKLFIDVKTLYFDTDNFLFYVLTDAAPAGRDSMVGFFSKEKQSFDDYNLACIVTLPQHQRKGFGMLMIEFSYELSRREDKLGTPERPLSDLGLRSYLAYWVATLIRFFRHVLSAVPPTVSGFKVENTISLRNKGQFPDLRSRIPGELIWEESDVKKRAGMRVNWTFLDYLQDETFTKERLLETTLNPDGSATTHVLVHCTLADIARASNLRADDAAFALNECGLLMKRIGGTEGEDDDTIVITRELVEKVALERTVKPPCMDLKFSCPTPDELIASRNWEAVAQSVLRQ
ncbi:acyl-CoA N-acyltransferase [Coprinopsis marcescibilis]|uniref:histone acetyltransferase n=1 Tax=Coprinopsis marcescibilis TaxID=230819 RepID=A0A5C3L8H4_COPMA|nr:acyl-CoA N-acyltransferase [Coprinopsis marcescibilis]